MFVGVSGLGWDLLPGNTDISGNVCLYELVDQDGTWHLEIQTSVIMYVYKSYWTRMGPVTWEYRHQW